MDIKGSDIPYKRSLAIRTVWFTESTVLLESVYMTHQSVSRILILKVEELFLLFTYLKHFKLL